VSHTRSRKPVAAVGMPRRRHTQRILGNTSFGLGITCSAGWYGYTGALPGYNTADYYSPATGITIVAWIDHQAPEPVEGVASVMVRDIARIMTPDHVPFVYAAR